MIHPTSLRAAWGHLLLHASPAYWTIQAAIALGTLVPPLLVTSFGNLPQPFKLMLTVPAIGSAVMFFLATHAFLRPALQLWFVSRARRTREWLFLLAAIAALALLMVALELPFAGPASHGASESLDSIVINTSSRRIEIDLTERYSRLMAVLDRFGELFIWALLYIAAKALQSRRQLERQVREARMRQLTYQLSPHFLFNAFNSIRGMIFEDRDRAAELITQLSELFRFHLSHESRTEQTLAEEWQLARRYLDLEAIRLESRLRLHVDLAEDCMHRRLPSLTLLTLVENAIKHGVAPNVDGGRLTIRARTGGPGWWLEVTNTVGAGRATHSTGTGLANLRERLALGHGAIAAVIPCSEAEEFCVRVEMAA
ncbi:sensor histidine kinase [Lysobacter korlensis]|uniref:Sensor histidine kinase n=1 Tax=Lysobacter korlensis TaxID=553636 RepID=A0ABV6RRG6_9GAMM